MGIIFFCQSCGARFDVNPRMAGKKGRCKKCGQPMTIPQADQIASMVAMPALAGAGVGAGARVATAPAASLSSWIKTAASNVGLAPLSLDAVPLHVRRGSKPSPLDDMEDSKPYAIAGPEPREARGHGSGAANAVVRGWRRQIGGVQKVFRWLNQSAYLVSIPFILIFLVGTAVKSRPWALLGAAFVVLLNIGRFVAAAANLAAVPLRDGLNTNKLKTPAKRLIEPVLTVAVVLLAFTFIPWLSSEKRASGSLADRLRSSAKELKKDIRGELGEVIRKAEDLDVGKLGAEAREKLKRIGESPADEPVRAAPPPENATPSPDAKVQGILQGVKERVRETLEESKRQP